MAPSITGASGDNNGITRQECQTFHNPAATSGFVPLVVDANCTTQTGDDSGSGRGLSNKALIVIVVVVVAILVLLIIVGTTSTSGKVRYHHSYHKGGPPQERGGGGGGYNGHHSEV